MLNNEKCVITADFDGITNWPVTDNDDQDSYYYSVDM